MPRVIRAVDAIFEDPNMTLQLECWQDELSPAQLQAYEKAENEHRNIRDKLNDIVSSSGGENVFLGEIFSAYHVTGNAPGLETIAKPVATVRKENRAKQLAEEKKIKAEREREAKRREATKNVQVIEDDDDEEYIPLSKRSKAAKIEKKKAELDKKPVVTSSKNKSPTQSGPAIVPSTFRPTENTSIGGLSVGDTKKLPVVDLTKDEPNNKNAADSREITFNKLQGKTFPSLVVVARPSLKVKDNVNDRPALDAKVKGVLMHTATKFTEWLIQQGLVRSEQSCQVHIGTDLKLGKLIERTGIRAADQILFLLFYQACTPTLQSSLIRAATFGSVNVAPRVLYPFSADHYSKGLLIHHQYC